MAQHARLTHAQARAERKPEHGNAPDHLALGYAPGLVAALPRVVAAQRLADRLEAVGADGARVALGASRLRDLLDRVVAGVLLVLAPVEEGLEAASPLVARRGFQVRSGS